MIYLDSDYMVGAHPEVMSRLAATNMERTVGYGFDPYTASARRKILDACGITDGEVVFACGGTQTNAIMIDRLIRRGEGVLAADTSHINVHEAGAVESNGHKVLALPSNDGKINANQIRTYIEEYYKDETWQHIVRPAMVYLTYPTELGTLYSKEELTDISNACHQAKIPLYIDGARLAYGLAANGGETTLKDLARLADVFYIGGTKCGLLFGEAIVSRHKSLLEGMLPHVKRHGALLAKGRLLGVQFDTLFTDNLYGRIGEHAINLARKLREGLISNGFRLFVNSPTNQQFFILPNEKIDELSKVASFEFWGPRGETESALRLVVDWSTSEEEVDTLISLLGKGIDSQ